MKRKTPENITKWEQGQVLIKAADCLHECAEELREAQPKFSRMLKKMALEIGTTFNEFKSHDFGLPGKEDLPTD